jgi:hypothetical protein
MTFEVMEKVNHSIACEKVEPKQKPEPLEMLEQVHLWWQQLILLSALHQTTAIYAALFPFYLITITQNKKKGTLSSSSYKEIFLFFPPLSFFLVIPFFSAFHLREVG